MGASRPVRAGRGVMPYYLAETYTRRDGPSLAADAGLIGAATRAPQRVRLVASLYLPADEVCFYLFESDSAELVGDVCESAGLRIDRVQLAVRPGRIRDRRGGAGSSG